MLSIIYDKYINEFYWIYLIYIKMDYFYISHTQKIYPQIDKGINNV